MVNIVGTMIPALCLVHEYEDEPHGIGTVFRDGDQVELRQEGHPCDGAKYRVDLSGNYFRLIPEDCSGEVLVIE